MRGGLRLREEGAPAERATAREAGKFLKSEKNSVLENDQNARLSPFPPPPPNPRGILKKYFANTF